MNIDPNKIGWCDIHSDNYYALECPRCKKDKRLAALERVAEASRNLVGDGPPLKDCGCSYCAIMEALKALDALEGK